MKLRDVAIAIVWIFFLAQAFSGAIATGHAHPPHGAVVPFPPIWFRFVALPLFFVLSSVGGFLSRRGLFYSLGEGWWLGNLIDSKWGAGTYREFLKRLRPTVLMILACLILGVGGLVSTYVHEQDSYAYFGSAFALTCGLGLLHAYFLSLRFPPRLY
jgi:hypothetical protein